MQKIAEYNIQDMIIISSNLRTPYYIKHMKSVSSTVRRRYPDKATCANMETLSRDFLSIISLINLNLKWIGLEFNPDKGPPRVNTSVIILGSAFYMSFLVHRLSETNNLALASQMMFHLPWMLQYSIKAANMYLQYPLAKDFMRWARNTLREHHPEPFVEQVMKEAHFRCLKVGKSLVR